MRYLNVVINHRILPDLIVNMDQQGVTVLIGNDHTFDETGAKQVEIVARDERRAYTLCVASTPAGTLLPFQQIWSGAREDRTLPSKSVLASAEAKGLRFTVAKSEKKTSHFSTLKTMKEVHACLSCSSLPDHTHSLCQWMRDVFVPHVERTKASLNLKDDQKSLLILDCYPVHTGKPFRTFVLDEFPNIFLMYIPANCELRRSTSCSNTLIEPFRHWYLPACRCWPPASHQALLTTGDPQLPCCSTRGAAQDRLDSGSGQVHHFNQVAPSGLCWRH